MHLKLRNTFRLRAAERCRATVKLASWAAVFLAMHLQATPDQPMVSLRGLTEAAAWQVVNDDVMGGLSTSQVRTTEDGTLVFAGTVSLENNGGFASVRSLPDGPAGAVHVGLGLGALGAGLDGDVADAVVGEVLHDGPAPG